MTPKWLQVSFGGLHSYEIWTREHQNRRNRRVFVILIPLFAVAYDDPPTFASRYSKTPTGKKRNKFLEGDEEEGKKEKKKTGKKKK